MEVRHKWWALTALVLPMLLISVDMTVLGFALPYLSADLAPSSAEQLWIVDIYSFVVAGLLVLMGTIGDRIGRRKLLLCGALVFCLASVFAAFSTSAEMLIVARALLGVGGATLLPSTLSMIRTVFNDPHQRRIALAVWGAGFSGGMALGPVVGGLLLEHFWWGSVFLINVPILVLLLIAGPFLLPEAKDPHPRRLDPLSAVLSLATILPVVYGIKLIAEHGVDLVVIASIVLGIGFGAWFFRRQHTLVDPMVDLKLFGKRAFSVSIATNFLGMLALMSFLFLAPQYLQLVLGIRPAEAALWMLPVTVAGIAGGLLSPQLVKRIHASSLIGGGMFAATIGVITLTQLSVQSGMALFLVGMVLINGGISLAETLTNDFMMSSVSPRQTSTAVSISEMGYELGGAVGVAVCGSVAVAGYRANLPADVPEAAKSTLGGAIEVASKLDPLAAEALTNNAREAFVHGMHAASWLAAAVLLYTAIQAKVLLHRVKPAEHLPEPA